MDTTLVETDSLRQALDNRPQDQHIKVLIIDDQSFIIESVREMLKGQPDVQFFSCQNPSDAIEYAQEVQPTVILQDLVMPEVDGLVLVRYFRANPDTRSVPMIVLSAEEDPKVKAEAFSLGANDYMVKLPDKIELIARIRYHSQSYIRLLQRNEAFAQLEQSQRVLRKELADAAQYVRSLLPAPIEQPLLKADWTFIPSDMLGGDSFGYHWLDSKNFAIYLMDVCGHGIGAALLSISVTNVLRTQALTNADYCHPDEVLAALNDAFPMEEHSNMFFTMWYGVFNTDSRILKYSSGGHPPAILISPNPPQTPVVHRLKTPGLVIGGMPSATFETVEIEVKPNSALYVFSDGVYELCTGDGMSLELEALIDVMAATSDGKHSHLNEVIQFSQKTNANDRFCDDFSLVEVLFY